MNASRKSENPVPVSNTDFHKRVYLIFLNFLESNRNDFELIIIATENRITEIREKIRIEERNEYLN